MVVTLICCFLRMSMLGYQTFLPNNHLTKLHSVVIPDKERLETIITVHASKPRCFASGPVGGATICNSSAMYNPNKAHGPLALHWYLQALSGDGVVIEPFADPKQLRVDIILFVVFMNCVQVLPPRLASLILYWVDGTLLRLASGSIRGNSYAWVWGVGFHRRL